MSSINNLPPPFPNAALSLSKVAGDAQLRAKIEKSSENAPIKTDFPPDPVQVDRDAGTGGDATSGENGKQGKSALDVTV